MVILLRARINVFGSRWSVHLVKCSELKYFLRGFPPRKATPGVVLIDTSPTPDLDMAMIQGKRPGDVQKEEIRPRSLHKTPSFKAMLNWTLFKSGRVNLQDKRTRHQKFAKQWMSRAKSGHSARRPTISIVRPWSRTKEHVGRNNVSGLKHDTDRHPKPKLTLFIQPSLIICKTIGTTSGPCETMGRGVQNRSTQPERLPIYIVWLRSRKNAGRNNKVA